MRYLKRDICKVSDDFGDNLRVIRREQNMTQQKLADAIGVDRRTIARYEKGETEYVTKENLKALSQTLGYDLETGCINDAGLMRSNLRELEQQNLRVKITNLEAKLEDMKDIMRRKDEMIAYLQRQNKMLKQ